MPDEQRHHHWIERCAARIQTRYAIEPTDAVDIAHELHGNTAGGTCPERAADELFQLH